MSSVLEPIVRVTALLGLTSLLLLALRRSSASTRHLVAVAGLAGALALPFLSGTLPHLDLPVLPATARRHVTAGATGGGPTLAAIPDLAVAAPARPAPERAGSASGPGRTAEGAGTVRAAPASGPVGAAVTAVRALRGLSFLAVDWAMAAWATVALMLLARLVFGLRRLARLERDAVELAWDAEAASCSESLGLHRFVRLLRSGGVQVPMTAGVLDPVVVLPESSRGWSAERRRIVLLHELAHVKRLDWLSLVVCEGAVAFWWLHPLAWLVLRTAHIEAEKATDELVVRAGARPSVYAGHLLEIVRALRGEGDIAGAMPMARRSDLEARLRALLCAAPGGPASRRGRAIALALAASAALLAVVRPVEASAAAAARPARVESHAASGATVSTAPAPCVIKADLAPSTQAAAPARATRAARRTSVETRSVTRVAESVSRVAEVPQPVESTVVAVVAAPAEAAAPAEVATPAEAPVIVAMAAGHEHAWKDKNKHREVALDELLADPHASADALYQAGKQSLREDDYDGAARAFREAARRSTRPGSSLYNLSCALALGGRSGEALDALQSSIENGFDDVGLMRTDEDLRSLHRDPRFEALVRDAEALELPGVGPGNDASSWERSRFERECREALSRLEPYFASHPRSGRAVFGIGQARLGLADYEPAARAFSRAAELGFRPSASLYNLACVEARRERLDDAFRHLDQAIDAGYHEAGHMRSDEDLDNLRGDPRYRAAIQKASDLARAEKRSGWED